MSVYVDTSAIVKLVVQERESRALTQWLTEAAPVVTSDLTRTELARAVRRVDTALAVRAQQVLDAFVVLGLTATVCDSAGRLGPTTLRSLDAIHLASALQLGDELDALVTYDERLAAAAEAYGVVVVAPGVPHRQR
ncbi:type II toxin-antitoxin system VapC family toxin [Luteimicrobium xylanilyticum]|uniref:Ribonuclease VapC n=1 Tax=Luteimicrobium xylanilyticum TaxID=1133546 RepID=A0A5P9QBD7_9MICO|nr:type II toxin-antitoxin system VapC family toxin [Luteimicrobium xylanilyticum]QFU98747.1 Ribonuclease VapC46 [Luteimicrobium xylanilyticum]